MSINNKNLHLFLGIIVLLVIATGTTQAIKTYQTDVLADKYENYKTSYLEINNNSGNKSLISFESIPLTDEEAMDKVEYQKFIITNTGTLPYVFNIKFLPLDNEGINSKYIKLQVNDYMPSYLDNLNRENVETDKSTYINKFLQNNYLFPGESMEINVKVWLDINTPSSEIGKSINLNLITTGYADNIYIDSSKEELEGTGTQDDPYLISSIEDLISFSDNVNSGNSYEGKYLKLNTSLNFNSTLSYSNEYCKQLTTLEFDSSCIKITEFTPIGNSNNPFKGTFDGNNNIIFNIPYNINDKTNNIGLFGYLENADIENLGVSGTLTLENTTIENINIGGIAAISYNSTINNCHNKFNYDFSKSTTSNINLGGIVGKSSNNTISDSYNYAGLKSSSANIAGIIGLDESDSKIYNVYNYGYILANNSNVGGISGKSNSTSYSYNFGIIKGNSYVGGITGYLSENIVNTTNYGYIFIENSPIESYVGGITGYSTGIIENSNNYITINANNNSNNLHIGGITGGLSNNINNSNNYGNINVTNSNENNNIGGLVGSLIIGNINNSNNNGYIHTTSGNNNIGGIVGYIKENSKINNIYNKGNITSENNKKYHSNIGGLIGDSNNNIITNIGYNTGNITISTLTNSNIGGILGNISNNGTLSYTYNTGDIIGDNISNSNIGGLVGKVTNSTVIYNYSTGKVNNNSSNNVIEACGIAEYKAQGYSNKVYCLSTNSSTVGNLLDPNTSFTVTKAYLTSKEFLDILNENQNMWEINPTINNGFPYLKELT